MKKIFFLLIILISPTFLRAQIAMEDIGKYTYYYGKDSKNTIYQLSYKKLGGKGLGRMANLKAL